MLFVLVGMALLTGKCLDWPWFSELTWWWVLAPFVCSVLWFELIERIFGLDVKRRERQLERAKKQLLQPISRESLLEKTRSDRQKRRSDKRTF